MPQFSAAQIAEALLPTTLWATFGRNLLDAMPQQYREEIGRKAIEGASCVSQLETINASRHARGVKPLSMCLFMAGPQEARSPSSSRKAHANDTVLPR